MSNEQLNNIKNEYKKQQKVFQKLEEDINKLKNDNEALALKLADPAVYNNKEEFKKVDEQYKQAAARLTLMNREYDKAFELMMELEEKMG